MSFLQAAGWFFMGVVFFVSALVAAGVGAWIVRLVYERLWTAQQEG